MQHKRVFLRSFQCIDQLRVSLRTQRSGNNGLSLTTGEQCRTMRLSKNARFYGDTANGFVVAAINAWLTGNNTAAHNAFLDRGENLAYDRGINITLFGNQCSNGSGFDLSEAIATRCFINNFVGFTDISFNLPCHSGNKIWVELFCFPRPFWLASIFH